MKSDKHIKISKAISNWPITFLSKVLLKYIIAKIEPINPNIAPLAPTEIVEVLNDKDTKLPNNPDTKYITNILQEPTIDSTIFPKMNKESIFVNMCSKLKCKNIEEISLYHSP